jgi:hypothetical protein
MASFSFRIPVEDKSALKAISELDELQFRSLSEAVQRIEPRLSPKGISKQLVGDASLAFMSDHLPSIARLLSNLGRGIYSDNLSLEEVTASLAGYAREEELIVDDASQAKLDERLHVLFSHSAIKISSKANAVLTAHPYLFESAKIFTEIRPLFSDDEILNPPSASVIAHQLRIDTVHNGSKSEIFIALDDRDLGVLKDAVERATRKSALLIDQERKLGKLVVTE